MSILSLSYRESDVTITNTSHGGKSWHRYYMKKFRNCHPIYRPRPHCLTYSSQSIDVQMTTITSHKWSTAVIIATTQARRATVPTKDRGCRKIQSSTPPVHDSDIRIHIRHAVCPAAHSAFKSSEQVVKVI